MAEQCLDLLGNNCKLIVWNGWKWLYLKLENGALIEYLVFINSPTCLERGKMPRRLRNGKSYFHLLGNVDLGLLNRKVANCLDWRKKCVLIRDCKNWTKYLNLKQFKDQPPFADSFADAITNLLAFTWHISFLKFLKFWFSTSRAK